jgi:hypothetical protein
MPSNELGSPGYHSGVAGSASTVVFATGERIDGIWAWGATTDGQFAITAAQGAASTDLGDLIMVRANSGREWNPENELINATVVFTSGLDWMIEFHRA